MLVSHLRFGSFSHSNSVEACCPERLEGGDMMPFERRLVKQSCDAVLLQANRTYLPALGCYIFRTRFARREERRRLQGRHSKTLRRDISPS